LFSFSRHVAFTFMPCCSRSCALLFASIACTLLLSPYCSYVHALLFLLLRYAAHALLLLLSCPTARSLLLLLSRLVVSFLHLAIRTLLVLLFSHPITRVFCSLSRLATRALLFAPCCFCSHALLLFIKYFLPPTPTPIVVSLPCCSLSHLNVMPCCSLSHPNVMPCCSLSHPNVMPC
jgi:hypothetical protein